MSSSLSFDGIDAKVAVDVDEEDANVAVEDEDDGDGDGDGDGGVDDVIDDRVFTVVFIIDLDLVRIDLKFPTSDEVIFFLGIKKSLAQITNFLEGMYGT
jgi:hypothetical protein